MGHCMMIILTYPHNVNANVQRCNEISFCHYDLDLIDLIQHRTQKLHEI